MGSMGCPYSQLHYTLLVLLHMSQFLCKLRVTCHLIMYNGKIPADRTVVNTEELKKGKPISVGAEK